MHQTYNNGNSKLVDTVYVLSKRTV